jgi:hypothetical protein
LESKREILSCTKEIFSYLLFDFLHLRRSFTNWGMPLFKDLTGTTKLNLSGSNTFAGGVIALHYEKS